MAIFKKRTISDVNRDIRQSEMRQKMKEKNLEALRREHESRENEQKLNREIRELKAKKPTFVKSFVKVTSQSVKTAKKVVTAKNKESNMMARKRRATMPKPKRLTLTGDSGIF